MTDTPADSDDSADNPARTDLVYEDFAVGQTATSPRVTVTEAEILDFASRFDPQPFHTDPAAAAGTFFGRLIASGWHTAAVTMRLLTESDLRPAVGLIGRDVRGLAWPRPVLPGDTLRAVITVVEMRESASRPDIGLVRIRVETLNQRDEVVQTMEPLLVVTRAGGNA